MRTIISLGIITITLVSCAEQSDPDCTIDGHIGDKASVWYIDEDEDGFGDPTQATVACEAPAGQVDNARDCDDADKAVHPDAPELCNGRDDDCDQDADEGALTTWYFDADADGRGSSATVTACSAPIGYVGDGEDCDDTNPSVYPGAEELCDGLNTDCDPLTSETVNLTCYADEDDDGHGDPATATPTCEFQCPSGFVTNTTDCNDANEEAFPGGEERCDGLDNDCDAATFPDEGANCFTGTPPTRNPANGHVYLVVASGNNFGSAGNVCGQRGYHLAWLDDAAEAAYVEALAAEMGNNGPLWVGIGWNICGQAGPFRRIDDRTTPDSCLPISAYEASLINGVPESGYITLEDGMFSSASDGTFLWYVCEAEP